MRLSLSFQSPFGVGAIARSERPVNPRLPFCVGVSIPFRGGGDCKTIQMIAGDIRSAFEFQSPFGVGAIASAFWCAYARNRRRGVSIPFRGGGDCKIPTSGSGHTKRRHVSIPFRGGGDCKEFVADGLSDESGWFQSPFGVGAIARPCRAGRVGPERRGVSIPFRGGGDCKLRGYMNSSTWYKRRVSIPFRGGGDCKPSSSWTPPRTRSDRFQSPFGVGAIASPPVSRLEHEGTQGGPVSNPLSGWGRLQVRGTLRPIPRPEDEFQSPFGVGAIAS